MNAQDLKNSILQLAIQGKLVEQREEEGTAKELIQKIKAEKTKLIEEGIIRKEKPFQKIEEDEKTFDVPVNWEWIRFGDLGSYRKGPFGSALTKSIFVPKSENTVKVYEQKNAIQKSVDLGEYYITRKYFEKKMRGFELSPGDIIVSCAGTIGETYVMPNQFEQGIINQALMQMKLMPSVDLEYFLMYFDFILKMTARKSSKGSAIKNIPPFQELKNYVVPLPPLKEQKRIVAKIEELMPYVEKYDKAYSEVEKLNKKFPMDMQKSLLQYAIQGKLVEQREEDGTAEELYKQIQEEKKKLIKEGKIKKTKTLPEIIEDEIPFVIPENWKWVRLGNLSSLITKGTTPRGGNVSYIDKGIGFLRAENIAGFDNLNLKDLNFVDEDTHTSFLKRSILQNDDILITIAGTLGRTAIVREENLPLNANQAVSLTRLINSELLNLQYLVNAINAPIIQTILTGKKKTTAIPNLTLEIISDCVLPLPPLEEQKRIVEKIEQLLPYTKQLVKKVD